MTAAPVAAPNPTKKASLRSLRCSSRHGSRFMRGMSVETPQCEAASRQQSRGVALHGLRLGAGGQLHLTERIAFLGRDTHTTRDDVGHAGNVGATAADQDFFGLLAA